MSRHGTALPAATNDVLCKHPKRQLRMPRHQTSSNPMSSNERTSLLAYDNEEALDERVRLTAESGGLKRGLSARQVQMIAIAGTIGTGLFLGTGRTLAQGGPASILLCYSIIGSIVYITVLLLGEMATQYPVSGSFNAYATRFIDDAYGFALAWNYWFNDAVSVATDLTAAQLVVGYWAEDYLWVVSVVFLVFLLAVNAFSVGAYGELEYWLSSLKVITVVTFVIVGIFVNVGFNTAHKAIGFDNWRISGAPFVGGFGGFAKVFVTASFAYGGTESLGITAGETKNPTKNMPRIVKFVYFRILLFYVCSIFLIGLNVPWNYPNLSNQDVTTSPFTLVFTLAGSRFAASMMNAVVLTSVLSAGNHALFSGTRVLHNLSVHSHAPKLFARTNSKGVPWISLVATGSISVTCVAVRWVGGGELWGWLQNLVGVSNQIAWLSIGLASWRFRKAWTLQGRKKSELKFQGALWTWGWGPPFVIISVSAIILIQGYSSFFPTFHAVSFFSLYLQIPSMLLFFLFWKLRHHVRFPDLQKLDLDAETHQEDEADGRDEEQREERLQGRLAWVWQAWYFLA